MSTAGYPHSPQDACPITGRVRGGAVAGGVGLDLSTLMARYELYNLKGSDVGGKRVRRGN